MITKPKGTYDLYGTEEKLYTYISNIIDNYMVNYNYNKIRTPLFEASELFHRGVGEGTDIVSKETYNFKDRGERDLTLRPEGTAGVVRALIENKYYGNRNDTIKFYYNGTMYRYERPQAGRYRELTQFGVEVFNSDDEMIDAEVISLGYNILKELGMDDIVVKLNTLGDKESRDNYRDALVKYLTPHIDELCEDCQARLSKNPLRILDCKVDAENKILKNAPKISDYLNEASKKRFNKIKELLNILDVDYEIDNNIVRGLDYYDHDVWEYYSESNNLALGGGGRYNNLVKSLDGPDMPAVGFALGIDRLIIELKNVLEGKNPEQNIDAYIMCVNEEEKMQGLKISQNLRLNNIVTELNTNNLSLKAQFKEADNLNAKFLLILNSEDLSKGLINIKDNATKEEIKIDENQVVDYLLSNI
jgi:histidyl-tRNA synthetase